MALTAAQKASLKRKSPQWGERLPYMPYFAYIRDPAMWALALKRMKSPPVPYPDNKPGCARMTSFTSDDAPPVCLVTMNAHDMDDLVSVTGVILHETVHVFQKMCGYIEEYNPSSEFEAYSIQHIYTELILSMEAVTAWRLNR